MDQCDDIISNNCVSVVVFIRGIGLCLLGLNVAFEAIHNQVASKLLVSGLLTGHICYVYLFFTSSQILYLYLISSVQVVCHFTILLTEAGVLHEAGYVDYI